MCGLVGVLSNRVSEKQKQVFMQLLFASTLRGQDSTGIIGLTTDYNCTPRRTGAKYFTHKDITPASFFVYDEKAISIVGEFGTRMLMGHCRSKTIGKNTIENAHPFKCGHVLGMHNGTLRGNYPLEKKFETDSEALFNLINKDGVKKAIGQINGAYALQWLDLDNSTVHFLRNSERELYFATEEDGDSVYWASERGLLFWILGRNGITVSKATVLKPDTHIWFDPLEKFIPQSIKVEENIKPKGVVETRAGFFPLFWEREGPNYEEVEAEAEVTSSGKIAEMILPGEHSAKTHRQVTVVNVKPSLTQEKSAVPLVTTIRRAGDLKYKGYKGYSLTKEEFTEILDEGCCYCGRDRKVLPVRFINYEHYLCKGCKDAPAFNFKQEGI